MPLRFFLATVDQVRNFETFLPGTAFRPVEIGTDGKLVLAGHSAGVPDLFYSQVGFLGSREPITGKPGLGYLPGFVVYSGKGMSFLEAFAHFKSMPGREAFRALYLEADGVLEVADGTLQVHGQKAGVAIVIPGSVKDSISQFMPGESALISELISIPSSTRRHLGS